jgi:hypothetical protein
MPITINGAGSLTGITAGGLPDASIVTADIADANITAAKLNGAQTGSAPIYGCRAWVNFDGTRNEADTGASTNGANVKIRASGNVTSVLKNAVGDYTVTFTTAMVDRNYSAVTGNGSNTAGYLCLGAGTTPTSSAYRLTTWTSFSVQADGAEIYVSIFR